MGERVPELGPSAPPAPLKRPGLRTGPVGLALQIVLTGSLLLLFVVPLLALFASSSWTDFIQAADSAAVRATLWVTFLASGFAVLAAVVFGIPAGYLLARRSFPGRSVVESLVALPVVVPHLLVGLGLLFLVLPGT